MNVICIVQARMLSKRLPGKVLKPLGQNTVIGLLLERINQSKQLTKIVVATSEHKTNDRLAEHATNLGYDVFRGDEKNVLERYYQAAQKYNADAIIRITGDCPLIDPSIMDKVVDRFISGDADYVSNVFPPTFPDGMDVEVFSFEALKRANLSARTDAEREHVTIYMRESGHFKTCNVTAEQDLSSVRLTIDDQNDYDVVRSICDHFHPNTQFSLSEIMKFISQSDNDILNNNKSKNSKRNQGLNMSSGQKLWQRAKEIIPAGNMLLSKRPEMFLPEQWPTYFSRTKGCYVWDLDGKEYRDLSLMGVGTNLLGYSHDAVDSAVKQVIQDGNMSTLNAPEEVMLAERLIDMHNFAEMARFCRTGGEANSVAVRIARAATGREVVAFCGYHGWHDWYLAANITDNKGLDAHLLSGLEPNGVPQSLSGSVYPFEYNKIEQLEALIADHKLAAIKMEVVRNKEPENDFLQKVRKLANDNDIVLIFDECTSGFRETFGGIHKKYNVEPDMAVFGKALGNGYAITSVIGRRSVMDAANSSFISSTFWTERIGLAAALKTLDVMEELKSWQQVTSIGLKIRDGWTKLADIHKLDITLSGITALSGFSFNSNNATKYKTLFTQEMLTKGYLATPSIYASLAHDDNILADYFDTLDNVFAKIKSCEDGADIDELLNGPVCHTGFQRLN